MPISWEITLPMFNIGDGDGDNDGEDDKDHAGDGYDGVQMTDSRKLHFSAIFKIETHLWISVTLYMGFKSCFHAKNAKKKISWHALCPLRT